MLRTLRSRLRDMATIKQLLERAESIARREGLTEPCAEHLVLAAFDLPDGTAVAALARVERSPVDVASALRDHDTAALGAVGVVVDDGLIDAHLPEPGRSTGVYRSGPSAQDLFQRAGADARAEGGGLLGAHVLRAAAQVEHGTVARVLRHMGVDPTALQEAATAEIAAARAS